MTQDIAWPVQYFDTIDSTNLEARRQIDAGDIRPRWIVADEQTGGRGRLGRQWSSPPAGNLYSSLIFRPGLHLRRAIVMPLLSALAVRDAICGVPDIEPARVWLKWPNDVLVDGAKVSGILIESAGVPDKPILIIGIGINIATSPDDTPYPANHLRAVSEDVPDAERMIRDLDLAMQRRIVQWREAGPVSIRNDWMAVAARLGEQINVRLHDRTVSGIFEGMDENGILILKTAKGPIEITAGDVIVSDQSSRETD